MDRLTPPGVHKDQNALRDDLARGHRGREQLGLGRERVAPRYSGYLPEDRLPGDRWGYRFQALPSS